MCGGSNSQLHFAHFRWYSFHFCDDCIWCRNFSASIVMPLYQFSIVVCNYLSGYMDLYIQRCYRNVIHNIWVDALFCAALTLPQTGHFLLCFFFRVSPLLNSPLVSMLYREAKFIFFHPNLPWLTIVVGLPNRVIFLGPISFETPQVAIPPF